MRISDWSSDVCSSDLGIPDQEQDRENYTVRALRRPLQIRAGNRLDRARSALAPPKLAYPCQRSADAIPALGIGKADVRTQVSTAHLVCRVLLEQHTQKTQKYSPAPRRRPPHRQN